MPKLLMNEKVLRMWNGIKMWEHKFQGMPEFCFVSFLVTEIPDWLLLFPAECPSSR